MGNPELISKVPVSKGVVHEKASKGKFSIDRVSPAADLATYVQHYWIARWDLRGSDPYIAETLPYPGVNLIFDPAGTKIFGVFTGKSDKILEGQGKVCAILFRPGGFHPFLRTPISAFTDSFLELSQTFGPTSRDFESAILASDDNELMVATAEDFLRSLQPQPDSNIIRINQIVEKVIDDRSITQVRQITALFHISERTLQALFSNYVGVGLKWVIMRYRLQDAIQRIAAGIDIDWGQLALDLGYADQPHFIKDFKRIIGKSPAEYARSDHA